MRSLAKIVPGTLHAHQDRSVWQPRQRAGLQWIQTVCCADLRAGFSGVVAERGVGEARLGGWTEQVREERAGCFALEVIDPRRVQDRVGMVGHERPFLWVDRDERNLGTHTGDPERERIAVVVVADLLLRHGYRG